MRLFRPAACAAALLWLAGQAALGASPKTVPLPPPAPPPAAATPLPPYQTDLERLAELMGTLAFMRDLCGTAAGADWRDKMAALLATEGTTDERRARLAGRFNRGYEGYRLTYRRCTPAAETIIARSLDEGARLAGTLSGRFGGE